MADTETLLFNDDDFARGIAETITETHQVMMRLLGCDHMVDRGHTAARSEITPQTMGLPINEERQH